VTDRPVILVFGAINQDEVARVRRHPVPCETVVTDSITFFQGGKGANQAFAAAVAGGDHVRVQMVGAIGDDAAGEAALASLHSAGVDTGLIKRVVSRPTGRACITVDDAGQNAIVVGLGANAFVSPSNLVRAQRPDVAVAQTELGADAIEATVPLSPIATACVSARVREPHMSSTPRARGTRSLGLSPLLSPPATTSSLPSRRLLLRPPVRWPGRARGHLCQHPLAAHHLGQQL
jgi:sugar/nucleoside kinase (ribokinase family)